MNIGNVYSHLHLDASFPDNSGHFLGLINLANLNVGWCINVRNSDIKHLAGWIVPPLIICTYQNRVVLQSNGTFHWELVPYDFSIGYFAYNRISFHLWCCSEVVLGFEWRATLWGSLRPNLSLAPLGMGKCIWSLMHWYRIFFIQSSTLAQRMHWILTEHGRSCMQKQPTPDQKSCWVRVSL